MKQHNNNSPSSLVSRQAAIVGIGCFFPQAPNLRRYWRLLYHGVDAITEVPESHWSAADYYDADPDRPDHLSATRGGFLSPVAFDPSEFGIPPNSLEATDSSQILGLLAAKAALEDAGYGAEGKGFDRNRTSVILGLTGTQELVIPLGARLGHPLWRRSLEAAGVDPDTTQKVIEGIAQAYVPWQENSFPGLLGNVVAGRISNRLDLGGTNCVVDAACASSLGAVHMALLELQTGQCDMVLTGGVDTLNDVFMHMCFNETRILSPTGDVRPFSEKADGTLLGEGVGIVVLKRIADARRDGDRIYAVIKAMGTASDGRSQSIYAPSQQGQVKALKEAYRAADVPPDTVELVEAHGTGTRVGDHTEIQTLKEVFGGSARDGGVCEDRCALGAVKSMIGHTKAAAGTAGMIKAALALHHNTLPPTLKAVPPDPKLDIDHSPFYLNTQARPWFSRNDHPRRCGVSAFGFGGSNFHLLLEEAPVRHTEVAWDESVEIVAISADSPQQLEDELKRWQKDLINGLSESDQSQRASQSRANFQTDAAFRLLWVVARTPVS